MKLWMKIFLGLFITLFWVTCFSQGSFLQHRRKAFQNDAYVTDWLARISAAGGAAPSAGTIAAANTFCSTLRANSLDTTMKALNIIAPDNLVAACTPLIKNYGAASWTNQGTFSGRLGVSGLRGNNSDYLQTGIIPNTIWGSTNTSAGMSMYISTNVSEATVDMGCAFAPSPYHSFQFYSGYNGTAYLDIWQANGTGGRVNSGNINFSGFMTVNRTASNVLKLYIGNQGTTFTNLATQTGTTIGNPTNFIHPMFVFAQNENGTTAALKCSRTISFVAIHDGLTSEQSSNLFLAVQTLRTNLGGGYR